MPVDNREFDAIWNEDLVPYRHRLGRQLAGVMPAHVVYCKVDPNPAGFSPFWLQEVLRARLGFRGAIFSDDLSMAGAGVAGGPVERCAAAWQAGCDMLLVCNSPASVDEILANWQPVPDLARAARIESLCPHGESPHWSSLRQEAAYLAGVAAAERLVA
jgi:beta-N-acetylhexosaminidase